MRNLTADVIPDESSPEWVAGVEAVVSIRCLRHRAVGQFNWNEGTVTGDGGSRGECGACIYEELVGRINSLEAPVLRDQLFVDVWRALNKLVGNRTADPTILDGDEQISAVVFELQSLERVVGRLQFIAGNAPSLIRERDEEVTRLRARIRKLEASRRSLRENAAFDRRRVQEVAGRLGELRQRSDNLDARLAALLVELNAALEKAVVPGGWRCDACGYGLSKNIIAVNLGGAIVSDRDPAAEECPNCPGVFLRRTLWSEQASDIADSARQFLEERNQAREQAEYLSGACQVLVADQKEAKRRMAEAQERAALTYRQFAERFAKAVKARVDMREGELVAEGWEKGTHKHIGLYADAIAAELKIAQGEEPQWPTV